MGEVLSFPTNNTDISSLIKIYVELSPEKYFNSSKFYLFVS